MADTEEVVTLLTRAQPTLHAYILSLLPDPALADDVLQETNVTLWRKASEYAPGTAFTAWACQVAWYKVLSARRRLARDRHCFGDELLDYLAERQAQRAEGLEPRRAALRDCLAKLPEVQRLLLRDRYRPGASVQAIARDSGRTVGVVSQTLYRIRTTLEECIRGSLTGGPA
jgi:RNA polymerase sigma-70 factor (ECF subfamily)